MPESKRVPEQIIGILHKRGPSLPIRLSKEIGISSLFISAYLSELAEEKRIKVSHLRVGGSPLYFLEGQEEQLEKFYNFLHPKEAEAFILLKKNKILKDSEQEPAIRVALRRIRDFAIGFKNNENIFWRYFSVPESEINSLLLSEQRRPSKRQEIRKPTYAPVMPAPRPQEILEPRKIRIQEIETKKVEPIKEIEVQKNLGFLGKEVRKKQTQETFLEEVKSYLNQKGMELVNLEAYDKNEVIAKIRFNLAPEKIHLLLAYNKKKINDKELLKAYKKAVKYQLDYLILFKGELSKKLKETIEAYKNLISANKL